MTTPSYVILDKAGLEKARYFTKAYNLEVQRKDSLKMSKLVHKAYATNPAFVFYKLRHHDSKSFCNAIIRQNNFLKNTRVVPIIGVSEEHMHLVENEILQIKGVLGIMQHRDTSKTGRWNI